MKYKNVLVLVFVIFLTGCDVEYHLDLDKSLSLHESIEVIATSDEDVTSFQDFDLHVPIDKAVDEYDSFIKKQDGLNYYSFRKHKDKLNFNYSFEVDDYINSTFVNNAYEFVSIAEVENELVLSTSKEFLLFDNYENLDNVKVVISSDYKLIQTNADEVTRHLYVWNINRENAFGKSIYLKLDTSKEDLNIIEKILKGEYSNIFTLSLLIFLVGFLIYYIFKKKSERRDRI